MIWQCPSVCPSVRPSVRVFRTFLQHALRYQFQTWYRHSVGGTTCRVWVASQFGHFDLVYSQKYVKHTFCNHGLINQDKFFKFDTQVACCLPLDISPFLCKNIIFRILAIFLHVWIFQSFAGLFSTCFEISLWNLVYSCSSWCYTLSSCIIPIWTLWHTLQPKIGQSHLSAYMALQNYIEASDLVHTLKQWVSWPLLIFVMLGQFLTLWWGGVSRAPSQRHMRFEFHQNQVSASEEFCRLFFKCFAVSTGKLIYTLSRLHNMLSSCFTRKGSLWPSTCS